MSCYCCVIIGFYVPEITLKSGDNTIYRLAYILGAFVVDFPVANFSQGRGGGEGGGGLALLQHLNGLGSMYFMAPHIMLHCVALRRYPHSIKALT